MWTTIHLLIAASLLTLGACTDPVEVRDSPPNPVVTAAAVAASDGQSAEVGTALARPLSVVVQSDHSPLAGVTVSWHTSSGQLVPTQSITDSVGIATTSWTLDTVSGPKSARAEIVAARGSPVNFATTALPGPAVAIDTVRGGGQTLPVNRQGFSGLIVVVTDRYGNAVEGETVTWTVEQGPVTVLMKGETTSESGQSFALVAPDGAEGKAVVRAALPGGESVDFALTVGPAEWTVVLDPVGLLAFRSAQNGTRNPAVDTLPAGATMTWILQPFDYERHSVASVGAPSFAGGEFPYANPSTVSVTFPTPGTYRYRDSHSTVVTGIIVVQ